MFRVLGGTRGGGAATRRWQNQRDSSVGSQMNIADGGGGNVILCAQKFLNY